MWWWDRWIDKEELIMNKHILSIISIFLLMPLGLTALAELRFVAPNNEAELKIHLEELHEEYAPYLRSLSEKVDVRKKTCLNGDWKFTFEVKDPPKQDTPPPPAPKWFGADFNDSAWETTTVPEWRYRTVGHDNVYNRKVDQATISGDNRNTSNICWYRRRFDTDKPKDGERLWLRFDGVQWEAQVYLNGEFIGSHRVYYEPFGFDVTDKIKPGENTLAVRVINGKVYGEPLWAWTLFPDIRAEQQRYTPNKEESILGNLPIGYHTGGGFGIWDDVYLETTGPVRVDEIFVRNDLSSGSARIKVELDSATGQNTRLRIQIMPENCDGKTYEQTVSATLPAGASVQEITVPMPDAKTWSPNTPNLYRCRVSVADEVQDVLFGCRSFTIVHRKSKAPVYGFKPIIAKWLRIVGRASDKSTWNSIWEVAGKAIVRNPESVTTSGTQKGYAASMALDGNQDTRWAVDGPAWIQFELDPNIEFKELTIGWYEAHVRKWDFDIMVSDDGKGWSRVDYSEIHPDPAGTLPSGMLMLNGKPCYMRGSNINGFNAYAYWGETDKLINAILLLKAGNFNSLRVCQHVQIPKVREMLDRLGIMTQQDQGAGGYHSLPTGIRKPHYLLASKVLTRITYNNPGVVLISLGNEGDWPTADAVRSGLTADPQRIYVPISGRFTHSGKVWDMPEKLKDNTIDDGHPYSGWYGGIKPQTWLYESPVARNVGGKGRMVLLGEFGAEALDGYETMKTYPKQFAPPPADADTLWAASQVEKHSVKQIVGLGRKPVNLGEYIEASQNYQEALLGDKIIQMRLLPRDAAGYFHFHFMDIVPVFWPKSIVSHDHRPKKAYYHIAQINQPVVVLPRLSGNRPDEMILWACNDLDIPFKDATVTWTVSNEGKILIEGKKTIDLPAISAVQVETIDLKPATWKHLVCDLQFTLTDADGHVISVYRRQLRCVPKQLLNKNIRKHVVDPFNKKKK